VSSEPEPLARLLEETLSRMGLPPPTVFNQLASTWSEVAGEPWTGQSKPLYIRQKELVVEAAAPALVSLLRYGVGDLLRRLDHSLGVGTVESVRVVPPSRP
jgi:hypothetical protein